MPIVLTPVAIAPPVPTADTAGVTAGQYRRRIAEETGNFVASTVNAASTTYLQDAKYPVRSSLDQGDLYTGKWLLRPDAPDDRDRVRVVQERGYDPGTGTIRPDSPWATVPVTDERYELHGVIEPWAQMLDVINEALKRCMVVDHLVLPLPTDGKRVADLTPYAPWLLDRRWVRAAAFVDSTTVDDPGEIDMSQPTFRGFVEQQGRRLFLRWQNYPWYNADQVLVVRCIRRAYDFCRADETGTFGERSGLAAEGHQSLAAPDWVAALAMVDFWNEFGDVVAAGNRAESEANQQKWAGVATTLTQQYFQLPEYTLLAPIKSGWGAAWY